MSLPALLEALQAVPEFGRLAAALPPLNSRLHASGLPGSSDAVAVAALAHASQGRFFVVIAESVAGAERWLADMESLGDTAYDFIALYETIMPNSFANIMNG